MNTDKNGKIAFIFPANEQSGIAKPTLNFKSINGHFHITVGISFINLLVDDIYFTRLDVVSPSGESIMSEKIKPIPANSIDPVMHTSFLSASMYLEAKESGVYTFKCELIESLRDSLDKKEAYFNVVSEDWHG
ncbi:hypothetical protein [Pantoea sp. 1.19]|uniref:hypothetical protein n=1 Tax=Pantoea sp. 1.19 TaxID=1925589 RepID=UPI0011151348|nr:hypothetical protein [Pantoea sp. 1.19]